MTRDNEWVDYVGAPEEMAKSAATAAEYGLPTSNIVGISKSGIPITKPTKSVYKKKSE